MSGPEGWFHRVPGPAAPLRALGIGVSADQRISVPIVAFLVEHPLAGPILIDTGFHRSVIDRPRENLGRMGALLARDLKMRPEQTAAEQLRARGVDPTAVGLILMTHLHFDHASALADFANATALVSAPEWTAALGPRPFLHGYSRAQLAPELSYLTLDFSVAGSSRRGPFEQALDLFADGSIMLVFTPGHSHGHLSIILRLGGREAFIAGDAIYTMATLRGGQRPWRSEDSEAFERSLATIQAYDREHPDAIIVPGHDMAHWSKLEARYA